MGSIVLSSQKHVQVDQHWPILQEKYLKIDWPVKMPLHWLIRELKKTTTATATAKATSPNKRFNEQNNSCARAL